MLSCSTEVCAHVLHLMAVISVTCKLAFVICVTTYFLLQNKPQCFISVKWVGAVLLKDCLFLKQGVGGGKGMVIEKLSSTELNLSLIAN